MINLPKLNGFIKATKSKKLTSVMFYPDVYNIEFHF